MVVPDPSRIRPRQGDDPGVVAWNPVSRTQEHALRARWRECLSRQCGAVLAESP